MIKNFQEFLLEHEETSSPEPDTKELVIGKTAAGTRIKATMKKGNTLKFSPHEFSKMINMKVSSKEVDMLTHMRGKKEYKVSKDKFHKYTIFHNNQTTHELEPVGVFVIPKKKS